MVSSCKVQVLFVSSFDKTWVIWHWANLCRCKLNGWNVERFDVDPKRKKFHSKCQNLTNSKILLASTIATGAAFPSQFPTQSLLPSLWTPWPHCWCHVACGSSGSVFLITRWRTCQWQIPEIERWCSPRFNWFWETKLEMITTRGKMRCHLGALRRNSTIAWVIFWPVLC